MGIRLPELVLHAKQIIWRRSHSSNKQHQCQTSSSSTLVDVPKGHFAIYVGDDEYDNKKKRFVVPISYLKHPLFQALLSQAAEEFGFDHPTGGLIIPCAEDEFLNLTSRINYSS